MYDQDEFLEQMLKSSGGINAPMMSPMAQYEKSLCESMQTSKISQIPCDDETEFDEENRMARATFTKNMAPDVMASFLIAVDGFVMVPINTPLCNQDALNEYNFIINVKKFNELVDKYDSMPDFRDDAFAAKLYDALNGEEDKISIHYLDQQSSMDALEMRQIAYDRISKAMDAITTTRDKVNFLYSLCSDNIRKIQATTKQAQTEKIFSQFVLQYIHKIESAKTEQEKNVLINKVLGSVIFDNTGIAYKTNQFKRDLGMLVLSNPLSMTVVLDTGKHANLFELSKSKQYKIMHSVDVSKINQFFDFSNLSINGDFICKNIKKISIILPKQINGLLDCSCSDIEFDRIPDGTTTVNFSHTIKSFSQLQNVFFPTTVHELWLATSTINQILNNQNEISEFENFIKTNPQIQVWDSKHKVSLQNLLAEAQQVQATPQPKAVKQQQNEIKIDVEQKTDEWITRKEIAEMYKNDERFADNDIDRLIKRAISKLNIATEKKSHNDRTVICVKRDNVAKIVVAMVQIVQEDLQRSIKQPKKRPEPAKKANTKQTPQKQKIEPIQITKFIPKQIWKDICDSCKDSAQKLYSVLQRIDAINIDYTKQSKQGSVSYIDTDGNIQVSPSLRKKVGNALAQSIEENRNSDRKRIVWTMNPNDKVMAAIAFCAEHAETSKASYAYMTACKSASKGQNTDGDIISNDFVKQNGYLNVADLLKQYTPPEPENTETGNEVVQAAPESAKKSGKTVETVTDTKHEPETRKKRPRIQRATLVDLTALDKKIDVFIAKLDADIKKLTIKMEKQKADPVAQLETLNRIKLCIQDKINLKSK